MNKRRAVTIVLCACLAASLACLPSLPRVRSGALPAGRPLPPLPPPNASIGRDDLDRAETGLIEASRLPAGELLGEQGQALFAQFDGLKSSLLTEAFEGIAASPPPGRAGHAQAIGTGLAFSALINAIQSAPQAEEGQRRTTADASLGSARGEVTVTVTRSGSHIVAEVEVRVNSESGGLTVHETATGRIELEVCPDQSGTVAVAMSLQGRTEATGQGSMAAGQYRVSGTITGHVNDNASLTGYEESMTVSTSATTPSGGSGPSLDANLTRSFTLDGQTITNATDAQGTWTGTVNQETLSKTLNGSEDILLATAVTLLVDLAQGLWQNGYCLEIVVEGAQDSNNVDPGSTTEFTAHVRHRFEGGEPPVELQAALTGDESLEPEGRSAAPVQYSYRAPREASSAAISLETRSRRGAAQRALDFWTGAPNYLPIAPAYSWSGPVCSLEQPFSLSYTYGGQLSGSYEFTPSGPAAGSVTVQENITIADCTATSTGTYTIVSYSGGEPQIDIIMSLEGHQVCQGSSTPFQTEYRILLVPTSEPSCQ